MIFLLLLMAPYLSRSPVKIGAFPFSGIIDFTGRVLLAKFPWSGFTGLPQLAYAVFPNG